MEVMLSLQPEELAAKILFLLRNSDDFRSSGKVHGGNLANQFDRVEPYQDSKYPSEKTADVKRAFFEAWAWLESQALLIWSDSSNGANGWRTLSRKAMAFESEGEFLTFTTATHLRPETLHASIAKPVWGAFVRGEFDVAIFIAMKSVEVAVREAGGFAAKDLGVNLMRKAFHPDSGTLTDLGLEYSEREALSSLFSGAIGLYKNPQSHRHVGISDVVEAIEIIQLASHLLRVVDRRKSDQKVLSGSAVP